MDIDPGTRICADGVRRPIEEVDDDALPVSRSAMSQITWPPANTQQTFTRTGAGGLIDVFFDSETVEDVSFVAGTTAAGFKTSIVNGLGNVTGADLNVTGANGGPFTLEQVGPIYGARPAPLYVILSGPATAATLEPGHGTLEGDEAAVKVIEDHEARLDTLEA